MTFLLGKNEFWSLAGGQTEPMASIALSIPTMAPDGSQFAQFRGSGTVVPPPTAANAPPGLYTAIQEQFGLKMEQGKVLDDVIVIDHVEKPSVEN